MTYRWDSILPVSDRSPLPDFRNVSETTLAVPDEHKDEPLTVLPQPPSTSTSKLPLDEDGDKNQDQLQDVRLPPRRRTWGRTSAQARFWTGVVAILIANFTVSLEPYISAMSWPSVMVQSTKWKDNDEHFSYAYMAWYAVSFYLGSSTFAPLWSRWLEDFSVRVILPLAMSLLLAGSVISGMATSNVMFFAGRGLAGAGASAVAPATASAFEMMIPSEDRQPFAAALGIASSTANVLGPVLGGIFCQLVSWRWSFLVSAPLAGAALLLSLFLPRTAASEETSTRLWDAALDVGWLTSILIFLQNFTLVLGLGDWDRHMGRTIAGICVTTMAVPWLLWTSAHYSHKVAVKMSFENEWVFCGGFSSFALSGAWFIIVYFAALRMQGAVGTPSPVLAGAGILALVGPQVVAAAAATLITQRTYRYKYLMLAGTALASIASGLLLEASKSNRPLAFTYAYLAIAGVGFGLAMPLPAFYTQLALRRERDMLLEAPGLVPFWSDGGRIFAMGIASCISTALYSYNQEYSGPVYSNGLPLFPDRFFVNEVIQVIGWSAYPLATIMTGIAFIVNLCLPEVTLCDEDWLEIDIARQAAINSRREAKRARRAEDHALDEIPHDQNGETEVAQVNDRSSVASDDAPPEYGVHDVERGLLPKYNTTIMSDTVL